MKWILVSITMFAGLICQAQSVEEIAGNISESFIERKRLDLKFLPTGAIVEAANLEFLNRIDSSVKKGEATWENSVGLLFGKRIESREEFIKTMQEMLVWQIQTDWSVVMDGKNKCGVSSGDSLNWIISKHRFDQPTQTTIYYVIFPQMEIAIRFETASFKEVTYLSRVDNQIHVPDGKGGYSCTIFCEEGKNSVRLCDLPEKEPG